MLLDERKGRKKSLIFLSGSIQRLMFLSNLLFAINEPEGSEKQELIKKAKNFSEERLGWVGSLIELLDRKERPGVQKLFLTYSLRHNVLSTRSRNICVA